MPFPDLLASLTGCHLAMAIGVISGQFNEAASTVGVLSLRGAEHAFAQQRKVLSMPSRNRERCINVSKGAEHAEKGIYRAIETLMHISCCSVYLLVNQVCTIVGGLTRDVMQETN